LSAAELETEREGERQLNAVLAEIFGPKESYGDSEVDAACAVLDEREKALDVQIRESARSRWLLVGGRRVLAVPARWRAT
jgi:hypothetical protein